MAYVEKTLGDLTATGAGTAVGTTALEPPMLVTVTGTFVGTVAVEVSMDGTEYVAYTTALTAPGIVKITERVKGVRANCTAFTSGTIKCRFGGQDTSPA